MATWTIEVSDELDALLQKEAACHDQPLDATVRGLLLAKMREVKVARVPLRARLEAAHRAFEDAKTRGENAARLEELDEAIHEVLDDIDSFELDLQEPIRSEDCLPLAQVIKELGYEHEIRSGSAGERARENRKVAGANPKKNPSRVGRAGRKSQGVGREKVEGS